MEIHGDAFVTTTEGASVLIPLGATDGVSIGDVNGTVDVELAASEEAPELSETSSGLLAYDNNDGSYTVPIPGKHGDLQLNTVISSASAPTQYTYELDLPPDVQVESANGSFVFLDHNGSVILLVAPPWAADATGKAVPTRYELEGATLTQVVEHSPEFSYPIVADPWMGIQLFRSWKQRELSVQLLFPGRDWNVTPWVG